MLSEGFINALVAILFFMLGLILSNYVLEDTTKNDAIENGLAEYIVNSKTGETTFVWLECDCND